MKKTKLRSGKIAGLILVSYLFFGPRLDTLAGEYPPGDGGIAITFSDDGAGGTSVTATGTGFTDNDADSLDSGLGFSFVVSGSGADTFDPIPMALADLPAFSLSSLTDPIAFSWGRLGTYIYDSFYIDFAAAQNIGFATSSGGVNIPTSGETMNVEDGMGTIPIPYSTFASVYGMSFPSMDGFTFVFLTYTPPPGTPPPPPTSNPPSSSDPPTIFVTDGGAIMSTEMTGINSMSTTIFGVQNAVETATGDINNRLFRAQTGGNTSDDTVTSAPTSAAPYLNFAANQNIDYRVALGLADGEEVVFVDSLTPTPGSLMSMSGGGAIPIVTKAVVAAPAGSGEKNPIADKVVIEDDLRFTRFTAYSAFDYGFYDQDDLTDLIRAFDSDTYAGSVGLEYKATSWLNLGAAFTYLDNNSRHPGHLGGTDLEGQVYSIYATMFHGNSYFDALYSYGDFDNEITRNTLLGRTAHGDTDSDSHNFELNVGHTFNRGQRFSFGPYASWNYSEGQVDGYTERNGGTANLIYPDHDFDSSVGRIGAYANFVTECPLLGRLTNQVRAAWGHEFNPDGGNITASLQTSPYALVTGNSFHRFGEYTAREERAHAGSDWFEIGATSRLDIGDSGLHLELGYQGMFGRNNATAHFGSAKLGYDW